MHDDFVSVTSNRKRRDIQKMHTENVAHEHLSNSLDSSSPSPGFARPSFGLSLAGRAGLSTFTTRHAPTKVHRAFPSVLLGSAATATQRKFGVTSMSRHLSYASAMVCSIVWDELY